MKNIYMLLCFMVIGWGAFPQNNTVFKNPKRYTDSVLQWSVACDKAMNDESYDQLRLLAQLGFSFIHYNDDKNISLAYLYKAVSFSDAAVIDSQIYYLNRSELLAVRAGDRNRILEARGRLLDAYNSSNRYATEQKRLAMQLDSILKSNIDNNQKLKILLPLSNYYNQIGQYEKQMECIMRQVDLLKLRQNTPAANRADTSNIGAGLYNIADIYVLLKDYAKAKEYYQSANAFFNDFKLGRAFAYKALAEMALKENQLMQAQIFRDSLERMCHASFLQGWSVLAAAHISFADYYIIQNKCNKAYGYLNKADKILQQYPDEVVRAQYQYEMGAYLTGVHQYQKALSFLNEAAASMESGNIDLRSQLLQALARCYAGLGQWRQAFQYYEQYAPLRDSIYTMATKQSIANAEAKYQNQIKQKEIDTKNQTIQYNRRQQAALWIGLGLMGLILILLFNNYRNKQKTSRILKLKNKELAHTNSELKTANETKAKLFGIISHDLRSPISQVYQFLRLQQSGRQKMEAGQNEKLSLRIQDATSTLLNTMEELLIWSKTQMNQFEPRMCRVVLAELITETVPLLQLNIEAKQIHIHYVIDKDAWVITDPDYLQTIVRNLLQNAIKAAPAGTSISIIFSDNKMQIGNEGLHFSQSDFEKATADENIHSHLGGLGLRVVAELSKKINVLIRFEQTAFDFTLATLYFESLLPEKTGAL